MRTLCLLAALAVLGSPAVVRTQAPDSAAGQIKGQAPDRGRPTKHDDEQPLLDFATYFTGGSWTFEWDVPEGPLGAAGRITGTTTYQPLAGKFFQAKTDAEGPDGKFTVTEVIGYEQSSKVLSRHVVDSRGFAFDEIATIGADLGGFYNILFESAPFTAGGHTVRIKHTMRLNAPLAYRVSTTVSVDDGPFTNYGNPWWRKQMSGAGAPH
jgi:hypothetical protein